MLYDLISKMNSCTFPCVEIKLCWLTTVLFKIFSFLWLQMLTYGRRIPYAELFARIDAVDTSTIKRVANRFIFDRVG